MSINKNTMEVTRKVRPEWITGKENDLEYLGTFLEVQRRHLMTYLSVFNVTPLNMVYGDLRLRRSREGLTLGWGYDDNTNPGNLFSWAFCADGTVEITFHNLKDISDLYKTEEELV